VLPLRWPQMRGEFHRQLERRLLTELESTYSGIPREVSDVLRDERREAEKVAAEAKNVSEWLRQREQSASITGLYGH
jgi:hypothetical protein